MINLGTNIPLYIVYKIEKLKPYLFPYQLVLEYTCNQSSMTTSQLKYSVNGKKKHQQNYILFQMACSKLNLGNTASLTKMYTYKYADTSHSLVTTV